MAVIIYLLVSIVCISGWLYSAILRPLRMIKCRQTSQTFKDLRSKISDSFITAFFYFIIHFSIMCFISLKIRLIAIDLISFGCISVYIISSMVAYMICNHGLHKVCKNYHN